MLGGPYNGVANSRTYILQSTAVCKREIIIFFKAIHFIYFYLIPLIYYTYEHSNLPALPLLHHASLLIISNIDNENLLNNLFINLEFISIIILIKFIFF